MRKRIFKKGMSMVLSAAMVFGLLPSMGIGMVTANAETDNTAPGILQYATAEELLSKFDLDADSEDGATNVGKIKFGVAGENERIWMIAGVDTNNNNALTCISTSSFGTSRYGGDYVEYSKSNFVKSLIGNYLSKDTNTYFSNSEIDMMKDTTITTCER